MQITYPSTSTINVTIAETYIVTELWQNDMKLQACKFIHKQYKTGLHESKLICLAIVANPVEDNLPL